MSALPETRVLAAALQRAALCDERDTAARVREEGRRLVVALTGLIRGSRLGGDAAVENSAAEVAGILERLVDALGLVVLTLTERGIEVNGLALRLRTEDQPHAAQLVQELVRHQLSTLTLHAPLDAAGTRALARALAEPAGKPGRSLASLVEHLVGQPSIELTGRRGEAEPGSTTPRDPLGRAGLAVRHAYAALAAERQPDLRGLRQIADELAQWVRREPDRAVATPVWQPPLGPGERHVLAVTCLALRLALQLGLDERALSDLGLAALLGSSGAAGSARPDLAVALRRLAVPRGFREAKLRRLLTALGESQPFQAEPAAAPPHLFARILRIARDYDLLTGGREGQPRLAPPLAQGALWAARGTVYDPDLLALFVQTLGLYPPGSLLELSDGRAVVSLGGARSAERFSWPRVQVVRSADGTGLGKVLELFDSRDSLRPKRVLSPGSLPFDSETLWASPS